MREKWDYRNRLSQYQMPNEPTLSCVLLTDGLTPETAQWFAKVGQVVTELVVLVDRARADEYTRQVAASLATRAHEVDGKGNVEAHLREMVQACRCDWILRLDSDERLAPGWDDGSWRKYLKSEHTHFRVPRQWFVTRDTYLDVTPWADDPQVRLFRNGLSEITFPEEIHEPMVIVGPGKFLPELPIEHHVLWLKTRTEREQKVARYLRLRPEKACANFYLFEEQLARTSTPLSGDRPEPVALAATFAAHRGRELLSQNRTDCHMPLPLQS
jgi:hypothetical protein